MAIITSLDNRQVYFDISVSGKPIGRVVIELFFDRAPLAAENFFKLCTNLASEKNSSGVVLSFKGNYFHRVIQNFIVQAGDLVYGHDVPYPITEDLLQKIGTGGASIYEDGPSDISDSMKLYNKFADEELEKATFETTFNVAMSNNDPNSNTSQFFINTYPSPHLDKKHTIFGKVVQGKAVIREIEKTKIVSKETFFPEQSVKIEDCGEFTEGMDVPCEVACYDTIAGDIYEEYPDDDSNFNKDDPFQSYEACLTIKGSGNALFKEKQFKKALLKFKKAYRYLEELLPEKDVIISQNKTPQENERAYKVYIDFLNLKKALYSNISLTNYKLQNYPEAIKYSTYLIEMLEIYPKYEKLFQAPAAEFVKCYFRIGKCYMDMNRLEKAKTNLAKAVELNKGKDQSLIEELEKVENAMEKKKETVKKNLAKFFS